MPTTSRALAAWSLFPLFVGALAWFAVRGPTWNPAGALGLPATANEPLLLAAAVTGFYTLIALLEVALRHRAEWSRPRGDLATDALHLAVTGPLASGLYDAVGRGLAATGGAWIAGRVGLGLWPADWPAVAQLFLAILVAELGHYWFHRISHERDLVWRLHATHHSAKRLYWLNATRFHPLDLFALIACQSTPLFLLGIDRRAYLTYALFAVVYGQLQHCNVEVRTPRGVDHVFSTPGVHRWHHSIDAREGNHNYGAILSIWDVVFGTFFRPPDRDFAGPVGIADLPRFPAGYLGQLAAPFRWARVRAGAG